MKHEKHANHPHLKAAESKAANDALKEHMPDGQKEFMHHNGESTRAVHAEMHRNPTGDEADKEITHGGEAHKKGHGAVLAHPSSDDEGAEDDA